MVTLPRAEMEHPAGYLFKDTPRVAAADLLVEMDRFDVELALIPVERDEPVARTLLGEHPDRYIGCYSLDPHRTEVQELRQAVDELAARGRGGDQREPGGDV